MKFLALTALVWCATVLPPLEAGEPGNGNSASPAWTQWRGPQRDGTVQGHPWPADLDDSTVKQLWRIPLAPGYSGPIVTEDLVFATGTRDKQSEVVLALDRHTGDVRWEAEWPGAMKVPFFAASNGSWIRSTPAYDGQSLYVGGMRDVLVSLDAATGRENWRVDFVKQFQTPLPSFGLVCSPLVEGDSVYVQAGASLARVAREDGTVLWRALEEKGGMFSSAFSSPVVATLAGRKQLVVQTRQELAGVNLETGQTLWQQKVPAFRGMNILTPVVAGNAIFTSTYQNGSFRYDVSAEGDTLKVVDAWSNKVQGYMSTPVLHEGHVYLHLQNRRFACLDLADGTRKWTSRPYGKYASLVIQGDRILALSSDGRLLLLRASPEKFELLGEKKVSEAETWAHLAVSGSDVFVRELDGLSAWRWQAAQD